MTRCGIFCHIIYYFHIVNEYIGNIPRRDMKYSLIFLFALMSLFTCSSTHLILMSWPKFKEYFVSRACSLISCKFYFFDWTIDVLDIHIPIGIGNDNSIDGGFGIVVGSPDQLVSKSMVWFFWLIISPFCVAWTISIIFWQNCSFSSQLIGYHAFNSLHSLNICVSNTKWFRIITITTMLTKVLLGFGDFGIIVCIVLF
jgi:hypothetical protein